MLALTRRKDEAIVIYTPTGETIEIGIADVGGGKVRIGVEAPPDFQIIRKELIGVTRRNRHAVDQAD
mgnify:CR=1 FL=1